MEHLWGEDRLLGWALAAVRRHTICGLKAIVGQLAGESRNRSNGVAVGKNSRFKASFSGWSGIGDPLDTLAGCRKKPGCGTPTAAVGGQILVNV